MAFAAAALALCDTTSAAPLNLAELKVLASRCGKGAAPSTLASIAQTESAREPFSINDNDAGTHSVYATSELATATASRLIGVGHSIDVGLMQINSHTLAALRLLPKDAFDPCTSLAAAAYVLAAAYSGATTHEGQQHALRVALSRYNTGDAHRGFENGYVRKVEIAARQIVPAFDLDVERSQQPASPQVSGVTQPPADPNAPPSWDVWSSWDYGTSRPMNQRDLKVASPKPDTLGQDVLSTKAEQRSAVQF